MKKTTLLPLELQIQIERERKQAEEAAKRAEDEIDMQKVHFREACDSDEDVFDKIDKYQTEMEKAQVEEAKSVRRPDGVKKQAKASKKVAPLVAALNE